MYVPVDGVSPRFKFLTKRQIEFGKMRFLLRKKSAYTGKFWMAKKTVLGSFEKQIISCTHYPDVITRRTTIIFVLDGHQTGVGIFVQARQKKIDTFIDAGRR